jgi:hypothetical protein
MVIELIVDLIHSADDQTDPHIEAKHQQEYAEEGDHQPTDHGKHGCH